MRMGKELIREINDCEVPYGSAAFWWLGQLGYAIKLGNTVLYIDCFLNPDPSRLVPPLFSPEEIDNADAFLGTHDHGDHIDRWAYPALSKASPKAKFVVPALHIPSLIAEQGIAPDRFCGMSDAGVIRIGDVVIRAIAAAHEFLDRDPATGLYPYLSYIITGNGVTLYHSGDTLVYEGMLTKLQNFAPFDVMFVPINGRDGVRYRSGCIGNMTFQEAADLAGTLETGMAVPSHFDMFANNPGDPALFADLMDAKYPKVPVHIPVHGQKTLFMKK